MRPNPAVERGRRSVVSQSKQIHWVIFLLRWGLGRRSIRPATPVSSASIHTKIKMERFSMLERARETAHLPGTFAGVA